MSSLVRRGGIFLLVLSAAACRNGGQTPDIPGSGGRAATGTASGGVGTGGGGNGITGMTGGTGGPSASDAAIDVNGDGQGGDSGGDAVPPLSGPCTPPKDRERPFVKLSETGCMDAANPTKFATFVIQYEVNSPLWSDGALKTRGLVVPAGRKIHVKDCSKNPTECCVIDPNNYPNCLPPADDGKWILPVGTVALKNFLANDDPKDQTIDKAKLMETRLFVRLEDGWVGYTYQWNEAQTEATLVPDDRVSVMFNTGKRTVPWTYPSRADCMKCHTAKAGGTLGLETAQLNRTVGGTNQVDRMQSLGLFDVAPAKPYRAALATPYASQAGPPTGATVDQRARSYLHANCAFCHRPDSAFYAMDLRYEVSLKGTQICNQPPEKGNGGVMGATNLTPGSPMSSVLLLRMQLPSSGMGRMPQIASDVVDQDAVTLLDNWITGIKACPM